jgi:hypothetical protein
VTADDRGEPLLRGEPLSPARPLRDPRQLVGGAEATVRHLLAGSVSDPDHQRALGVDVARVGIGRGRAVGADQPVELAAGLVQLALEPFAVATDALEPGLRLFRGAERLGPDHAGAGGRHRGRVAAGPARSTPPEQALLRCAERPQHDHELRLAVRIGADQVAAVGWAEQEPELELDRGERSPRLRSGELFGTLPGAGCRALTPRDAPCSPARPAPAA